MGFGGKGEHMAGYIQLWLKVGLIASLARFHMVKTEVVYHVLLGWPWLHKHHLILSMYHQCVKGRLNDRMIRIVANPSPFDERASSGESSISKPSSTFVLRWRTWKMTQSLIWGNYYHEKGREGKHQLRVRTVCRFVLGSKHVTVE